MRTEFQAIISDFDYTLADSSKGAENCINFALNKLGLPTVPYEVVCRTIGLSLPNILLELAREQHISYCDEFARLFIMRADEVMADLTVIFEIVPGTIRLLNQRGLKLGIVSTKFRYRIERILRRENLLDFFDVIVGGEDVLKHKPDPEGLLMAVECLGISPQSALYVGDSVTDAETAERAKIPFVAVLSGKTKRPRFDRFPNYGIIESLSELPALVYG